MEQFKTAHNMHVRLAKPAITPLQRRLPTAIARSTPNELPTTSAHFTLARPQPTTDNLGTAHSWQRRLQLRLDVGTDWHVGIRRKDKPNEDSLVAFEGMCLYNARLIPFGLFIVADGMGGHANGQDASYLAIHTMLQTALPGIVGSDTLDDATIVELLAESVQQANRVVYQRGCEIGADTGTTLTAALVLNATAFVINVGDSRTYVYREYEGLRQVTRDHSRVARLVEEGKIRPDEVYTHPDRNQVYRALGEKSGVEVDWFTVSLQPKDRLLLCSDGVWEMVRDLEIEKILSQAGWNAAQDCKALVQAAIRGGGDDNISAIVVHVAPQTV